MEESEMEMTGVTLEQRAIQVEVVILQPETTTQKHTLAPSLTQVGETSSSE